MFPTFLDAPGQLCIYISDRIIKKTMTEEFFYHYTSKRAAKLIIYEGKISPSLKANRDAIHGEGVYLTTLDPKQGKQTIKNNNWDGVAAIKTETDIEVIFEIQIPSSKVVRANNTRDIQVYKGPLQLRDYRWNLKNWDGQLLATQFFMVSSEGRAKDCQISCMGRYSIVRDIVTWQRDESYFVYKKDEGKEIRYLYKTDGGWCVGYCAGDRLGCLQQINYDGQTLYSPSTTKPWEYYNEFGWQNDDKTLKVFCCYLSSEYRVSQRKEVLIFIILLITTLYIIIIVCV